MKTDIEIAQATPMRPITEIAAAAGLVQQFRNLGQSVQNRKLRMHMQVYEIHIYVFFKIESKS